MRFTIPCRKCSQVSTSNSRAAQPIRGSAVGLAPGGGPPVVGYIVKCPHCGTENVVRPEQGA
jgi:endogenous inhibitor of DNA gyrase (YacG/DUF329 family)